MSQAPPELVEILADIEHQRWAGWMKHQFSLQRAPLTMTQESFDRWTRQVNTPYGLLSEPEKESDRREVRKTLDAIEAFLNHGNPPMPDNLIFFPGAFPVINAAQTSQSPNLDDPPSG